MSNYFTGYYPGMTKEEVAKQDEIRHKQWMKRQAIRRMECIRYEVQHEDKFRNNNPNYINPLDRGDITIEEYQKIHN